MDVRKDGAWVSPSSAEAYVGGAWRALQYGEAYISGAWRRIVSFASPFTSLSISPFAPGGASSTSDTSTSDSITAYPNGGLGPFAYSWTLVSSTNLIGITINSPFTATTTVTATVSPGGAGAGGTATIRCTATDALGTSQSATVNVGFVHDAPPGGGQ